MCHLSRSRIRLNTVLLLVLSLLVTCLLPACGKKEAALPWPEREIVFDFNPAGMVNQPEQIIPWEELEIYDQFWRVELDGRSYDVLETPLPKERIGPELTPVVLKGHDSMAEFQGKEAVEHTHPAVLYAIEGISVQCAVAVEYEGESDLYPAYSSSYQPETLGQFIEDLSLKENLVLRGDGTYYHLPATADRVTAHVEGIDPAKVWELLSANPEAENNPDLIYFPGPDPLLPLLEMGIDFPLFGIHRIVLTVCEDGYVTTNLLGTGKAFHIGEDHTQAFLDYVLAECDGYIPVYTHTGPSPSPVPS